MSDDLINHPSHHTFGGIETIDFIEAKQLGYHLGNVVKYVARAGRKAGVSALMDLKKAQWYLNRSVDRLAGQEVATIATKKKKTAKKKTGR